MNEPRKIPFIAKALPLLALGIYVWYKTPKNDPTVSALIMLVYCTAAVWLVRKEFVHFPGWLLRAMARAQDGKLQGKLYVFDQVRIHLYLLDDDTVWIAADGVKMLLSPSSTEMGMMGRGYGTIPGTAVKGVTETALLQLLAKRQRAGGGRDVLKFDQWLRQDALPNLRRLPSSSQ